MTGRQVSEKRRDWRLEIWQAPDGLYRGRAHAPPAWQLSSRGPTAAAALEALRKVVDDFDDTFDRMQLS